MKKPTIEDLECLIRWPEGTVGCTENMRELSTLLTLMEGHGFGAIPQMARWIEDIWNHPERIEHYEKQKREHFELMEWPPDKIIDDEERFRLE